MKHALSARARMALVSLGLAAAAAPSIAQAVTLRSFSQAVAGVGTCGSEPACAAATLTGSGTGIDYFQPSPSVSATLPGYGNASALGAFASGVGLPTLHSAAVTSNPAGSYATSFVGMGQGYTWTGPDRDLGLFGSLDFLMSTNPSLDPEHDAPGQASVTAFLWILAGSAITDTTRPIRSINRIDSNFTNLAPCGVDGVIAAQSFQEYRTSGAQTATLDVSNTCSGSPFHVAAGDQFYVVAFLRTEAYTGGVADALNTFRVGVDPDDQDAALQFLVPNVPGEVPEPEVWALMTLGFGGIGAALRRRRPRPAAQAA